MTKENSGSNTNAGEIHGRLGTFAGVFTPSILTILGIILFLRLGYITGSAGLALGLLILCIANMVTIITSLSLAAVATNLKVKGGGDYYLISRTLGYKFGGSIGIVLYLAQSVSVAFYCIGFAEAFTIMVGSQLNPGMVAAVAVSLLFVLAWLGADWATKFQYSTLLANWSSPSGGPPFWIIFALFFPAVTGFTQGVSMSGDLKDPGKSLPLGTLLAVAVSIVVYISVMIIFAGALTNQELMRDYQAMQKVSRYGFLIDAGVIAATLSSAMASFMGGPRILQSLAVDRIFPLLSPFAKGEGDSNNPRRGILLTAAIALATISLGQLNLIAQIVSLFFLISYGLLNYATYYEASTDSTSFRPRFRYYNKYLSLAGAAMCLSILLALDRANGLIALTILFVIFLYLKNSAKPARWADSSRSHAYSIVRKNLQQMSIVVEHNRDWSPHLLIFTNHQETREKLLVFGDWLCGQVGLMSAIRILNDSGSSAKKQKDEALEQLQNDIKTYDLFCYAKVICSEDFSSGLSLVLQSHGLGPLHGNTVLTNWHNSPNSQLPGLGMLKFGHNLMTAYRQGYNLIIFHCGPSKWQTLMKDDGKTERIDIWWQGDENNSRLMLLFSYLLTRNSLWEKAEIRVLTAGTGKSLSKVKKDLMKILDDARIPAEAHLVEDVEPPTVIEQSKGASIVFLPFRIQQSRITDVQGYSLERVLSQLPPAAFFMAAEEIDLDAEPEEGKAGQLAKAMDDLYDSEKRSQRAKREEKKASIRVERLSTALRNAAEELEGDAIPDTIAELQRDLFNAEEQHEKLFRKMAKSKARYENSVEEVRELGGFSAEENT